MSDFTNGFRAGMQEAARAMRIAAEEHMRDCAASKKVVEAQGNQFAAAVLAAWANGLEINAERALPTRDGES